MTTIAAGAAELRIPLGVECRGGCELRLYLASGADATRDLGVPTSPLFALTAPELAQFSMEIDVPLPSDELDVSLALAAPVAPPGGAASFTVSLRDAAGAPVAGRAVVFAVDNAFHAEAAPACQPLRRLRPRAARRPLRIDDVVRPARLRRRPLLLRGQAGAALELEPWLPLSDSFALKPTGNSLAEQSDAQVLASHTYDISEMPSTSPMYRESGGAGGGGELLVLRSAPMAMMASAEMEMDDAPMMKMARTSYSGDVNGGGGGGSAPIKVLSDNVTTPLIRSTSASGGGRSVDAARQHRRVRTARVRCERRVGGGTTATQLVRKMLTLQARPEDRASATRSCGATVTASPELPAGARVVVSVELSGGGGAAVQLKGSASQQLRLDPSQTTEIVFEMEAVALGAQKLVARVSEEGAASGASSGDAIEMEFEVKGAQPEVMVATSRAIRATGGVALWSEGISLPAAVPGSGGLNLTVGVGRLPAVLSAATNLLDAPTRGGQQPISDAAAPELVASLAPLAMLLPYAAQLTTTRRWIDRATAQLNVVAAALAPMTDASTGLHYSRKAKEMADGADMRLDAHALYILRRLRLAGAALPSALTSLETSWRSALATALPEQVAL